jgi:hypothetical protein
MAAFSSLTEKMRAFREEIELKCELLQEIMVARGGMSPTEYFTAEARRHREKSKAKTEPTEVAEDAEASGIGVGSFPSRQGKVLRASWEASLRPPVLTCFLFFSAPLVSAVRISVLADRTGRQAKGP